MSRNPRRGASDEVALRRVFVDGVLFKSQTQLAAETGWNDLRWAGSERRSATTAK
jgi:hypothetical protein